MNARDDLDGWLALLAHPKWKELEGYAEAQKTARMVAVINSVADVREEDKLRGEYLGIGLFMQYPHLMVENLRETLAEDSESSSD